MLAQPSQPVINRLRIGLSTDLLVMQFTAAGTVK